jgi:hypothetical protein
MTGAEVEPFLFFGSLICAIMAVVSGLRFKTRGVSAYIMAMAFLVLGGTMLLLRARAPQWMMITGCVALFLLLVADFAARSAHNANKDSRL